jgi:hypothetical protein
MSAFSRPNRQPEHLVQLRILEALREIGVLIVALAPLDVALSGQGLRKQWPTLLIFLVAGLLGFLYSVWGERRIYDAE